MQLIVVMKELSVVAEKARVEANVQTPGLAIRLREGRVPKWTEIQNTAQVLPVVLRVGGLGGGGEGGK